MRTANFLAISMAVCCLLVPSVGQAANVIDTTPGLLYHLDAGLGVTQSGGAVSAWADQSGNGNNFAQGNTVQQPTLLNSVAAFNNLPAIQFDGAVDYALEDKLILGSDVGTAQTVFIVESTTTSNFLAGIWGQNNNDTGVRREDANTWQYQGNGGNANDYPTSIFINGVATATQANDGTGVILTALGNADFSSTGLGSYFNCCGAGPRPFGGDIAEVAVYSGALDSGQRAAIESYLQQKYFPTPEPSSLLLLTLGVVGLMFVARKNGRLAWATVPRRNG